MHKILQRAAVLGAGVLLTVGALAGPASAAGSGSSGSSTVAQKTAADAAAAKAANGGREVNRLNNTAFASGGMSACGSGNFCAWDNYNYSGGPGQWSGNASNYTSWNHTGCGFTSLYTWDNCASSVFNNGNSCNITLYDDINYNSADGYYNLARGGHLADLRIDQMTRGGAMNDRISSHKWCTW
jgi:peptidase inhibitor family I36